MKRYLWLKVGPTTSDNSANSFFNNLIFRNMVKISQHIEMVTNVCHFCDSKLIVYHCDCVLIFRIITFQVSYWLLSKT